MQDLMLFASVLFVITLSLFSFYRMMGNHSDDYPTTPDYIIYIMVAEALIVSAFFVHDVWFGNELPNNFTGWIKLVIGALFVGGVSIAFAYYIGFLVLYAVSVPFMFIIFILDRLFGVEVHIERGESFYNYFNRRIAVIAGVNIISFIVIIFLLLR